MGTNEENRIDDLIQLSFFSDIGKAITSARNLRELFRAIMDKIGTTFAPADWSLLLRNHATGQLTFVLVIGGDAAALKGKTLDRGQGVAGWIAENGQPVIIADVDQDRRFDSTMDKRNGFVTRSIIGVPLKSRTRVFGVIELINKINGEPFTPFELKLLGTIADFAAIAIEKLYYIEALRKNALTDPLTKLNNRRMLMPFISRELERVKREQGVFSLLFIDIDDFKEVNDKYGHGAGDEVLRGVADLLRHALRKTDFICRWGGDEFVAVMPGKDRKEAEMARDRIIAHSQLLLLQKNFGIGLSVGIHEAHDGDAEAVIAAVDRDMYEEKMRRLEDEPEDMPTALEDALAEQNGNS